MIDLLTIEDLGVIESATLPLGPGFTAITGETGAGKTMVITALALLMGERSDAGSVRAGADRARVVGVVKTAHPVVKDLVEGAGGEVEDKELVIVRTVNAEGRSRASAGGISVPAQTVQKISPLLFALHGQSDQLRLKSASRQRDTLDRFGGEGLNKKIADHKRIFREHEEAQSVLQSLTTQRLERQREAERLHAEISEIDAADAKPGEIDELKQRIERLSNIEELREATSAAKEIISSSDPDPFSGDAATLIATASREIDRVKESDEALQRLAELAQNISVQLDELHLELANYANALDAEGPEELMRSNQRLETLSSLTRKYGSDIEEVLRYRDAANEKFQSIGSDDLRIDELTTKLAELGAAKANLQKEITELRKVAAAELSEEVTGELRALALPEAKFLVEVLEATESPYGADQIEMRLLPHPGAEPRPIAKGASGGELSRVMLALEVALAGKDPVPTFVFDEIDSGVGGQAAIEIGRRLKRLAKTSQVIVVTHLAQVAAFADNHLMIEKDSRGGFTKSSVKQLQAGERDIEMARLLSGMPDSENALSHARELLEIAKDA